MPRLTIHLDDGTARKLEETARKRGLSKSALAADYVRKALNRFSDEWLALGGTWLDDRTTEEIMADIRQGPPQRERASFD